jgi:predicted RNase H-like nuclease (RuvC/YqgF family)
MGEDTPYSVFINHCRTEHPDIDPLTICRDLSGLTHQGVGILFTKSPGFPGVEALAIASSQQEEGGDIMNENEKKLFDELEAIKASMSTLEAENATHKETISRMETEKAQEASTKEVETLTASLAEASTKIESLASALEAEKKINEDTKAEIAQNEKINSYFAKAETLGVKFSEEEATTLRSDTFKRWKEEDVDMFLGVKKAALAVASSNHTEVPNPAEATKAIIPEHKSTLQAVSSEFDVTNIKFKL